MFDSLIDNNIERKANETTNGLHFAEIQTQRERTDGSENGNNESKTGGGIPRVYKIRVRDEGPIGC